MRKIYYFASCILFSCLLSLSSCTKDLLKKTTIVVHIVDYTGDINGDCNLQICKQRTYDVVYSKMINYPGTKDYTFTDVKTGDYAFALGSSDDSKADFSIKTGETVTVTCTYSNNGDITLGNYYSGYYSVPYNKWETTISHK